MAFCFFYPWNPVFNTPTRLSAPAGGGVHLLKSNSDFTPAVFCDWIIKMASGSGVSSSSELDFCDKNVQILDCFVTLISDMMCLFNKDANDWDWICLTSLKTRL